MTADDLPAHLPSPAVLHDALLAWFDANRRDLPWRRRRSLYGTWISEMMLQQTTVATVVPYWERFLARFPDVASLAAAPEADVLAAWSGLGYYRRARQLHAAARRVVAERGGALPTDAAGWRDLPGVGPYAAGAVASLGLGLPEPAVDANVRRVLTRWLGEVTPPPGPRRFDALARALVCPERPGDWNEALMELGATVCAARQPRCDACPLAAWCATGRDGPPAELPAAAARPAALPVRAALLVLWRGGRLWLEPAGGPAVVDPGRGAPVRDDFAHLHPGLLTLPMTAWYDGSGAATGTGHASERPPEWRPDWQPWPPGAGVWRSAGRFRHAITRFRLQVDVLVGPRPGPDTAAGRATEPPAGRPAGRWATPDEAGGLAVSQLTRKALRLLDDGRG